MAEPEVGGQACCILEICCGGEERLNALAKKIQDETPLNAQHARTIATWILAHYDLAPKGLLSPLIRFVAENAREYPPSPGY